MTATTADIPLIGGSADGGSVRVELDATGRPPLTHHHLGDSGLADAEIYELESTTGDGPPWHYTCRGPAS